MSDSRQFENSSLLKANWRQFFMSLSCYWQWLIKVFCRFTCVDPELLWQSFNYLVGRQLAWFLTHQASEYEKLLAQKENLLVQDNGTALFLSPVMAWYLGYIIRIKKLRKGNCFLPQEKYNQVYQLLYLISPYHPTDKIKICLLAPK